MGAADGTTGGEAVRLAAAAEEFLAQRRIAVVGVSHDEKQPANLIFRRLRDSGHEVLAVNPAADQVEGARAYRSVLDLPGEIDGAVIVTPAAASEQVVDECAAAGIPRVWLHRALGTGSFSQAAVDAAVRHELSVIPGGCPNMFGATSDPGHRVMRRVLQLTGSVPRCAGDYCCLADANAAALEAPGTPDPRD